MVKSRNVDRNSKKLINIMLVIDCLKKIKEDPLRLKILIPLYKSLGCLQIRDNCGPNERGKDIFLKEPDIYGSYLNTAIVIKAIKITKGENLDRIKNQLQEAGTSEYVDLSNPRNKIKPDKLVFVTSKEITSSVYELINSQFGTCFPMVKIIDGGSLADIIEGQIKKYNLANRNNSNFKPYKFTVGSFKKFCDNFIEDGSFYQSSTDINKTQFKTKDITEGNVINK
jgi:hypothetical protein